MKELHDEIRKINQAIKQIQESQEDLRERMKKVKMLVSLKEKLQDSQKLRFK